MRRLDAYEASLGHASAEDLTDAERDFIRDRAYQYLSAGGGPPPLAEWNTWNETTRELWVQAADLVSRENADDAAGALARLVVALLPSDDDKAAAALSAMQGGTRGR